MLAGLAQSMGGVPMVAKILAIVVMVAGLLSALVSALIALWHAVVGVLLAVGAFPKMQSVAALAAKLQVEEQKVDDFANNKLIPILNRLSVIPLPQK